MSRTSITTVAIQLICIALLVLTGPVIPRELPALVLMGAGVALIFWAIASIGLYNLRVEPEVSKNAKLITWGPFRVIRHPMYSGGILIAAAWIWNDFTALRVIVGLVLAANFIVKLHHEERLLAARFPEYGTYMKGTKRLVPFVY